MCGVLKKKINIYCGWHRNTMVRQYPHIEKEFIFTIKCLECKGTGLFDCGIEEENGICVSCKGTGEQYVGTI